MAVMSPCRTCGATPRETARFCDACGSLVHPTGSSAEYKQVTVLFADVVRSMDIAVALGAERLREVMAELFEHASTIVQRHGGTVDKFTGDGLMAVFGAPVALEDHAVRACRAALDIQEDTRTLAREVERRDKVTLQLRIGLNSGEVIAGEIGSGPLAYTAVGEQVGMAQRMEAVAPPGEVLLSESTVRLVENATVMGEPAMVDIKGADAPVSVRRLLGMAAARQAERAEPTFVGRQWELGALKAILQRSIAGHGCIVGVVGPPGIGKSRIVGEIAALAGRSGADVSTTYCEAHAAEIPLHAATDLIRAALGADGVDGEAAREQVRARLPAADEEDLLLLDDLLGIRDSTVELPPIDADARRRRLTAMLNAASLARTTPALHVIEDVHWIDEVSESLLAEFLTVVPRTPALVLITYRPEYSGTLAHPSRSHTIALEPLDDAQVTSLGTELLGGHSSVAGLAEVIAGRAAGNPFFAEEIVRDLAGRGVLLGQRGNFVCTQQVADVSVPATLRAVIAARIDRLGHAAKRTLNAAAVIGSRFVPELLVALDVEPVLDELVRAELIDQTSFAPSAEFMFRHPLIRAVAYESQLRSDRAQLHRRLAATIEPAEQNAALIAEHLEAAGELRSAYDWHMRAGVWATNRDNAAAQLSWERARHVADALPDDHPDRMALRIAPRTALCGNTWRRFHPDVSQRFNELQELCTQADDKASLAVGMMGMTVEHILYGRVRDASRLASEYMALVESLGDETLTVGLSFAAIVAKQQTAELADVMRWSQQVIDLAGGDPDRGNFILGSPLAAAVAWRGVGRWSIGLPGWREDLEGALAMARAADPLSQATVVSYIYGPGILHGVLVADDGALDDIETALTVGQRSSDDMALILLRVALGAALIHYRGRRGPQRQRGYDVYRDLRRTCVEERFALNTLAVYDAYLAREEAERGEVELAVQHLRASVDGALADDNLGSSFPCIRIFVETLVARGTDDDLQEAAAVVAKLANSHRDDRWGQRDVTVLRLRALVARARGDEQSYQALKSRYRAMAEEYGFEGHMEWAEAMP